MFYTYLCGHNRRQKYMMKVVLHVNLHRNSPDKIQYVFHFGLYQPEGQAVQTATWHSDNNIINLALAFKTSKESLQSSTAINKKQV